MRPAHHGEEGVRRTAVARVGLQQPGPHEHDAPATASAVTARRSLCGHSEASIPQSEPAPGSPEAGARHAGTTNTNAAVPFSAAAFSCPRWSGREDLKPSDAPGTRQNPCNSRGETREDSDASREQNSDSPGSSGELRELVRASVTEALATLAIGRLDLAREALTALLCAIDEQENKR